MKLFVHFFASTFLLIIVQIFLLGFTFKVNAQESYSSSETSVDGSSQSISTNNDGSFSVTGSQGSFGYDGSIAGPGQSISFEGEGGVTVSINSDGSMTVSYSGNNNSSSGGIETSGVSNDAGYSGSDSGYSGSDSGYSNDSGYTSGPPGNFYHHPPVPYCAAVGLSAIHLAWTQSSGATGYNVYWVDLADGIVHGPAENPYLSVGYKHAYNIPLAPEGDYTFLIEAYNNNGWNHTNAPPSTPSYWSHLVWPVPSTYRTPNCSLPQTFTITSATSCQSVANPITNSVVTKSVNATHYDIYRYNNTTSVFDPISSTYQDIPTNSFWPGYQPSQTAPPIYIPYTALKNTSYAHWGVAYNANIAYLFSGSTSPPGNYFIYNNNPSTGIWTVPPFQILTSKICDNPAVVVDVNDRLVPSGTAVNLTYIVNGATTCTRSVLSPDTDSNWSSGAFATNPAGASSPVGGINSNVLTNTTNLLKSVGFVLTCTNEDIPIVAGSNPKSSTIYVDICAAVPAKLKTTGGSVHSNNQIIGPSSSGC